MSTKKSYLSIFVHLLTAVLFFVGLKPYFMWGLSDITMLLFVTLPIVLLLITHTANMRKTITASLFGLIALIAALSAGRNIFGCIVYIMSATIFLNTDYLQDTYIYFKKIYVYFVGISAIVWILVLLGVSFPSETIMPLNQLKSYSYIHYPFLVMPEFDLGGSIFDIIRFCGPFDEPGVIGSISLLMLAGDNYNLRKPTNIVLFIVGVLSLSLFFYLGSFICIILCLFLNGKINVRKISWVVIIAVLLVISYHWEVTHTAIWERLEFDEDRGFSGNNRAEYDLVQYMNKIRGTTAYWFGVHDKNIVMRYSGSASIQNAILQYGVIGCLLYAFFFVIYTFKQKTNYRESLCCIIILFMTLWQRPFLYDIAYLFLYLVLIKNFGEKLET